MSSPVTSDALQAQGWEPVDSVGFVEFSGPFWKRLDGDEVAMGLVIQDHHANSHLGTVHGGVVMTLADNAFGLGVAQVLGGQNCSTISLQTHFVSVARVGEMLICRPEIVRKTKNLVFIRGLVMAGDRVVANADGIWKVLSKG